MQSVPPHYPNDPNLGKGQGWEHQGHQKRQEMSQEEMAIFRECQFESFYYRSLPFSLALGGGVMWATNTGKLTMPAGRFGMWPRVISAAVVGYLIGRVSYINACRNKFLQKAPNSNMSIMIKKASGMPVPEVAQDQVTTHVPQVGAPPESNTSGDSAYSDYFAQGPEPADKERKQGSMSYDILRKRHREGYQGAHPHSSTPITPYASPPPPQQPAQPEFGVPVQPPPSQPPPVNPPPSYGAGPPSRQSTNKYGDEGFE